MARAILMLLALLPAMGALHATAPVETLLVLSIFATPAILALWPLIAVVALALVI
jgi:hypothetical protein